MEKLDKQWFNFYKKECSFDDIDLIKPDPENLQKQKELFFSEKIDAPFITHVTDTDLIKKYKESLKELEKMVSTSKTDEIVREAYLSKIEEQETKLSLIDSIKNKDDQSFFENSVKIYGKPQKETLEKALEILNETKPEREMSGKVMDTQELISYLKNVLAEKNIPWEVKEHPDKFSVSVNYTDETIYVPTDRTSTQIEAESLVEHEVGVHLARHINGLNSPLLLLSSGLDRYLKGEEGLAVYKQVSLDRNEPGIGNFLSVAYATGTADKPLNFRQIYEFQYKYRRDQYRVNDEEVLREQAWKRAMRTFRGTTGQTPGTCFTRDITYFLGFLETKELFDNNDPELERILKGKYDPANEKHIRLLDHLGI